MIEHLRAFAAVNGRPPRIAFTLHELGQGGTDRVCGHLARGFAEAGFAVELIVLFGRAPSAATMLALAGPDVTVHVLTKQRGSRHMDRLLVLPRLIARLRASAPDVVISTGNNMTWVTALACQLAGIDRTRLILKITNPVLRPKDGPVRRFYRHLRYRIAFEQSAAVLTLGDREADQLRQDFPSAADRIAPVINPYVTPAMLASTGDAEGERDLILSIGRLVPQKRYDLLIRAFALIRTPGARLVILGEGPERRSLERLVEEQGVGDRVSMPGYRPDVEPMLRRARVFVLSSRYEGLPAAVLEAMAVNCPVVTTDCFLSARSLVGEVKGCAVVSDSRPESLARAIEACWSSDRPSTLTAVAQRYGIANGVESHLVAVGALIQPSRSQAAN